MKTSPKKSLRTRLRISYLLICVVPLLLTVFIVSFHSARNLQKNTEQKALLYSTQIVKSIDSFTESYSNVTRMLAMDYDIISELDQPTDSIYEQMNRNTAVRKLLMRVAMLRSDIQNVMLLTSGSMLYQYSGSGITINRELLLEQEWMQELLSSESHLMITPTHYTGYYENEKNRITVSIARRLFANNGLEAGILIIDIDPYALIELTTEQKLEGLEDQVRVIVRTATGKPLYDSQITSGDSSWSQLLQGEIPLTIASGDYVQETQTSEGLLDVLVVISSKGLWQDLLLYSRNVTIVLLLSIIIVFLISSRIADRITKPVSRLQKSMGEAERGNYELLPAPSGEDEIAMLVQHYNHMIDTIHTLIDKVYLEEIREKDAKLLALRAQINPHVLYNTLEAIRMKAVVNQDPEVANMVKLLSRMFRSVLDADPKESTIRTELSYIGSYVELQNLRFRDRYHLHNEIPESLWDLPMIPITFQPILENSFEHGGRANHEPMDIVLSAQTEGHTLLLDFRDNGTGMSHEKMEELNTLFDSIGTGEILPEGSDHIALRNIAERLYLRYGRKASLRITKSDETGTTVRITLPYEEETNES